MARQRSCRRPLPTAAAVTSLSGVVRGTGYGPLLAAMLTAAPETVAVAWAVMAVRAVVELGLQRPDPGDNATPDDEALESALQTAVVPPARPGWLSWVRAAGTTTSGSSQWVWVQAESRDSSRTRTAGESHE